MIVLRGRERKIECVVWRRMRSWGVIWIRVRTWMVVDLYDRYEWRRCAFVCSSTTRERYFGGIGGFAMEMIWLRSSENENEWRNAFKTTKNPLFIFFFLFLFHFVPHLHTPTSSFHTEPSISLSWCPSWWLWVLLCWWWLLFQETTHKHFVTQFRVFVHWTVFGSLPHAVWAMITVLPSLLHPVQPGNVLFLA